MNIYAALFHTMTVCGKKVCQTPNNNYINNNNNLLHLYSAFLGTQSALHRRGNLLIHHQCAASTWMMRRQPYCARTPPHTHTSLLMERRQSDEVNQCIGMIRRPWWSEDNGQIWRGCRGYTLLFFEGHPGIFNDHRESGPRFNVSSDGTLSILFNNTEVSCIFCKYSRYR